MKIELYDHQLTAMNQLRTGSILCGGVGSGKSITSLAYFVVKVCAGTLDYDSCLDRPVMEHPRDLYIITTARKRDTYEWDSECARFLISKDISCSVCGIRLVVDSWNNVKKYLDVKNAFFIFDEQRVVGSGTWVKSFLKIVKKNDWILLSATPGDCWMDYVPVFIANGFYKNRSEFIAEHVIYSYYSKYPVVDRYVGVKKLEALRASIMVDMPFERPTVQHHEMILCSHDRQLTKQVTRTRWDPYNKKPVQEAGTLCYVLRRVTNSDPSRLVEVEKIMIEHPKVIIFYNFDYELDILRTLGCAVAEWNGHKKEAIPDTGSWAYLVQYTAGAEGWNCILTDTVIFYSQSYSYKTTTQAAGRIDRLNSPFVDLYYFHLYSLAPIDAAIQVALKNKKEFNVSAFCRKI